MAEENKEKSPEKHKCEQVEQKDEKKIANFQKNYTQRNRQFLIIP